ncbi:MAG: C40 family peptidase [Armatimonadetes bacterium]|nr:C40 family peptidase [Armatimonadota bacterium]
MVFRRILGQLLLAAAVAVAHGQDAGAQAAPTKVIGRLGQIVDQTRIFRNRSVKSRTLFSTKLYQYLVVNPTDDPQWLAVTMVDGSLGYVLSDRVAQLPYDVTAAVTAKREASLPSRGGSPVRTGTGADAQLKQSMLNYSYNYIGTKYVWGGEDLKNGIDCSGFVMKLFGKIGVDLPRTADEQSKVGRPVERLEDLQPGDRLSFWDSKRGKVGHTGIFLGFFQDGGAYFIHSSSTHKGVATDDLRQEKWRKMLVYARRDTAGK